ncbi:MAG: cyclase family protein [Bacteroidales bacterium]|nr:cyclase family protein [Bacteroidales bacterium]
MEIIDLSHLMENGMPAYPGEESPVFGFKNTHKESGYQVIRFTSLTHSGTHLDTPAHFFSGGLTIDKMPVNHFAGKGVVIDCSSFGQKAVIPALHLQSFNNELLTAEFALIYTGWDKFWKTDQYYVDFPVLSVDAAIFLSGFNLKGIGVDVPSIDPVASPDYPNHNLILGKGLIIIENLTKLHHLSDRNFYFSALPLKIKNGDGCPVRAVGITDIPGF